MTWNLEAPSPGGFLSHNHHTPCGPGCPASDWTPQYWLEHNMATRKGLQCRTCSSNFGFANAAAAATAASSSNITTTTTTSSGSSSSSSTAGGSRLSLGTTAAGAGSACCGPEPPPPINGGCVIAVEEDEATVLFTKGEAVLYRQRDGSQVATTIAQVDLTVVPPQYAVRLPGAEELRFTVAARLTAVAGEPSTTTTNNGSSSSRSSHVGSSSSKSLAAKAPAVTLEQEIMGMSVGALKQMLQAAGVDPGVCTYKEGMVGKLVCFQQRGLAAAGAVEERLDAAVAYTAAALLASSVEELREKLAAAGGLGYDSCTEKQGLVGKLLGYRVQKEELVGVSVGQLKQEVRSAGGDPGSCLDKKELVELLLQLRVSEEQEVSEGCVYQHQPQQQEYLLKRVDAQQQQQQQERKQQPYGQNSSWSKAAAAASSHGLEGLSAQELKKLLVAEGGRCSGPVEKADLVEVIISNRQQQQHQERKQQHYPSSNIGSKAAAAAAAAAASHGLEDLSAQDLKRMLLAEDGKCSGPMEKSDLVEEILSNRKKQQQERKQQQQQQQPYPSSNIGSKAAAAAAAASHGLEDLSAQELKRMLLAEGGKCSGPMEKSDLVEEILSNRKKQQQERKQQPYPSSNIGSKAAAAAAPARHGLEGLSAQELKKMLLAEGGRCCGPMEKSDLVEEILSNRKKQKWQQQQQKGPQSKSAAPHQAKPSQQQQRSQQQQQQQRPPPPPRPELKTCCCCHAMHNVTAPGPDGSLQQVKRYITGQEGAHIVQRPDGLWVCEWCSTWFCHRCWGFTNDLANPQKGQWSQELHHLHKCKKHSSGKKGAISREVLKGQAQAWDRAHCQGCRDRLLTDRMMDMQKVGAGGQNRNETAKEVAEWAIKLIRLGGALVGLNGP